MHVLSVIGTSRGTWLVLRICGVHREGQSYFLYTNTACQYFFKASAFDILSARFRSRSLNCNSLSGNESVKNQLAPN